MRYTESEAGRRKRKRDTSKANENILKNLNFHGIYMERSCEKQSST